MKNLIIVISLVLSFEVFAQDAPTEASWKTSLRSLITSIAGAEWGDKIVGPAPIAPVPVAEVPMPEIPKIMKSSTNVESYTKKAKDPTEYDRLPAERRRQFDYKFIEELYQVTRRTEVKDEDLANWLNNLDQGGSREGIYQGLVLDEVYSAMEAMEERPSKKLVDFYIGVSQKYLNQALKPESLQQLNLYSLKRILTEKSLDLIEHFETKELDLLYRWYANFSADQVKDQGTYMKSEVRQNPSAKYHYEWAKNMPVQHLKSEFIIKLHTVMNGLQSVQE
ncbi:MAG TPA: hypothetical protein VNJ08_11375 [Bacteriovoracaceae bacterium]|nr:hypothetical protein [Bacteriovoracaceae bacterium]